MASLLKLIRPSTRDEHTSLLHADGHGRGPAKVEEEGEGGLCGGDLIKSIVFGGVDGIITTASTLASSVGGSLSTEAVLTLTLANLLADGLSMGLGDFISSKAEMDHLVAERKREVWEYDNHPEGEREEMVQLLLDKGFEDRDAQELIELVSKPAHKEFFIDYMMTEELGLEIADDLWAPYKDGAATFVSFLAFGSIPLLVYVIMWGAKYTNQGGMFGVAALFTAVALFALGALQGRMTRASVFKSGLYMTVNGSMACAAAYLVGWALQRSVGTSEHC